MACIHQIDLLGVQKIIVLQIRRNKSVAAIGNSLGNIAAAGTATVDALAGKQIRQVIFSGKEILVPNKILNLVVR